ncbi:hypothetical protein R1sor_009990 [Riccia sorocarpa]|uniref:Cytochrome P450 n=1 Tax=Riccia sorocarpa TaxID=122646 RepID=A0ABD3I2S4_9MARC
MENFSTRFLWVELLGGLLLGVTVFRLLIRKLTVLKLKLPPGPGGYPIVGSFPLLGAVPGEPAHQMFKRLQEKYGPIVYLQMGSCPTIIVADSETAKAVLRDQDHLFASRPLLSVGKYLGFNYQGMVWSQMGDHYKQMRKIFAAEILSPKRVMQSHEVRENGMQATISSIFDEFSIGQGTNLTVELNNLSLNNLMNMLFGRKDGQLLGGQSWLSMHELKDVVREVIELSGEFDYGDYLPIVRWLDLTGFIGRLKSTQKRMKAISGKIIEQHREHRKMVTGTGDEQKEIQDHNILDVLLSLKGEDALRDDAITGVIFDVIIAGSDTTSISADWAIAELMRKPELLKKLQSQIDMVVGKERMVKESDLPHLPYLHCVIKESLRMHSPAPLGIPHCSIKGTKLAGYDIPGGSTVLVNLWALNRDPKNWPNPDEFRPERHEVNDVNMFGQDFTLLPFGSGRRGCSGMVLGFTMVQLIVASIIHSFDLEPYGMQPSDIDVVQEKPGITMVRAQELFVKVTPRLPTHLYQYSSIH